MSTADSITQLLSQWQEGDMQARDKVSPLVYVELHRIASHYMYSERDEHTLQPTALINEMFIKILGEHTLWHDRKHFYAVAARQMRHILIDYARAQHRIKRGSNHVRVEFNESKIAAYSDIDIIEIDDALGVMKKFDQRKHDILELYYFGGLKIEEIARSFDVSTKTVQRELRLAEAWLFSKLYEEENDT